MDTMKAVLTEAEASLYTGMSRSWLSKARMNGGTKRGLTPPPHLKIGRSVRYKVCALDQWLDTNTVEPKPFPD